MKDNEKMVEQTTGAEIICHSMEDLEFYVKESTKLIEKRHEDLLQIKVDQPLYVIKRKIVEENEDVEVVLIYDAYYVVFTSVESAETFMDSFMDISMKAEVEIVRVENYGELMHRLPISMLGDGLIMKRIEFKEEKNNPEDDDIWHCEDLIYDPAGNNSEQE